MPGVGDQARIDRQLHRAPNARSFIPDRGGGGGNSPRTWVCAAPRSRAGEACRGQPKVHARADRAYDSGRKGLSQLAGQAVVGPAGLEPATKPL